MGSYLFPLRSLKRLKWNYIFAAPPFLWIPASCEVAACVIFDFHSEPWLNGRFLEWILQLRQIEIAARGCTACVSAGLSVCMSDRGGVNIPETQRLKEMMSPCPDYHDSLVSDSALMLAHITILADTTILAVPWKVHEDDTLPITFLPWHPFPFFFPRTECMPRFWSSGLQNTAPAVLVQR